MAPDELTAFERSLPGDRRLIANAGADLAEQAHALLDTLAALDAGGPPLDDGRTVQFGWSRLTIRRRGPAPILHVHEPDFLRDPAHATVPHVDRTLRVLRDQAAMLHLTGASPMDVYYDQIVVCEHGALLEAECYFERRTPQSPRDSGWTAGRAAASAAATTLRPEDLTTMPVYRLLIDFPAAMPLLALPPGYLAIFRHERLVTLFRPGGTPVSLAR